MVDHSDQDSKLKEAELFFVSVVYFSPGSKTF